MSVLLATVATVVLVACAASVTEYDRVPKVLEVVEREGANRFFWHFTHPMKEMLLLASEDDRVEPVRGEIAAVAASKVRSPEVLVVEEIGWPWRFTRWSRRIAAGTKSNETVTPSAGVLEWGEAWELEVPAPGTQFLLASPLLRENRIAYGIVWSELAKTVLLYGSVWVFIAVSSESFRYARKRQQES